jgi:hypothetical protein
MAASAVCRIDFTATGMATATATVVMATAASAHPIEMR